MREAATIIRSQNASSVDVISNAAVWAQSRNDGATITTQCGLVVDLDLVNGASTTSAYGVLVETQVDSTSSVDTLHKLRMPSVSG